MSETTERAEAAEVKAVADRASAAVTAAAREATRAAKAVADLKMVCEAFDVAPADIKVKRNGDELEVTYLLTGMIVPFRPPTDAGAESAPLAVTAPTADATEAYNGWSLAKLKAEAKRLGVKSYSGLKAADRDRLIEMIEEAAAA